MSHSWSQAIFDRYHVRLPDDVRSLLDNLPQAIELAGEFDQIADMDDLLSEAPRLLLPGMMLPNVLPIVSNRYGDWLCGLVNETGTIVEVLHWYHGGGDWIPYGNSLAEALLYDACQAAVPNASNGTARQIPFEFGRWLAESLNSDPKEIEAVWSLFHDGLIFDGLQMLLECEWCQVVVHRDLIEMALAGPLRNCSDPALNRIGSHAEITRWKFDATLTPESSRDRITQLLGMPFRDWSSQNWALAEEFARRITQTRSDLAWAWHIAGYAEQVRDNTASAAHYYYQGLGASVFSDQSVRMRTHWFEDRFGKFSAAQLYELRDSLPASVRVDDYLKILWSSDPSTTVNQQVTDYWQEKAIQSSDSKTAYDYWMRAGWDVGCQQWNRFETILDGLVASAQASDWSALAKLAQSHLHALRNRQLVRRS
jgi:hypothetical protein